MKKTMHHTQAVALVLSNTAQRAPVGWGGEGGGVHGPRIFMATLQTKKQMINMGVIQCFAQTKGSIEDVKEKFYSRFSSVIQSSPRRNIAFMMEDFNSLIGGNNRGYEEIMEQHGLGEMNNNGDRFTDL